MNTYVAKNLITIAIFFVLNWIHNCYEVARAHAIYGLSYKWWNKKA